MALPGMRVADHLGAFRIIFDSPLRGKSSGPLAGRRFAAKDLFDVEGYVTGCGNPDWERTHPPAERTAAAVEALLDAGADLVGKTHTDELAYSLNGENAHFGTPVNARAPGRIPGGSSNGSASVVAGGGVDFALGTDTGGSVRLPASYCGLYGIRPTHGSVSLDGCVPLASSFDTAGWFARTADLLLDIGRVLLQWNASTAAFPDLMVADSVFELCDPGVRRALEQALVQLSARIKIRSVSWTGDLPQWSNAFRTLQAFEAWRAHGEWITRVRPRFGPGIEDRFASASSVTAGDYKAAQAIRETVRKQLADLLADGNTLLWPTTPCIALPKGLSQEALDPVRRRILCLTCVAGLGGLPQVTMPVGLVEGCPVGLSLLGAAGQDLALLEQARELVSLLGEGNG